ncbi:TPA: cell division protein FtsZ [Legionella pneumophila]|uniref:cell division protein FtsZ n=1 Tax=Legionella pneumophila TaxID=446 RepID=UPI0007875BD7|nr:cell division protein FtsZ [Legionella pneumophila]MDW8879379.1 cell division protein FtsZ [Legionella pneumophila subsp. fraseri]MDW8961857.1 cell division protein FtsZ [Legionella pneumophila subsp. fraseri]MDW9035601.1 cell division protein FtsZ [Legionella pneumophila subsp. fraseri]MDW9039202.1 cell division protein FtsZ [Legionella pneumophila subsp. fraseri]MDW9042050.1 cell division protein FtsZ [Legionella pneumophila subsp. fraseri]
MFELMESSQQENNAVIKVVGVGGGGGNAVEHMVAENIDGVEFICANTDAQALRGSSAKIHIQLGDALTKGLGAGANPQIGREAAEEDREHIKEILSGADMVFITAGMGGGTGTGAAPVFAEIAKELGILTVAVVTKPFSFEGKQRALAADEGIRRLAEHVDSLITIPNNKLLSVLGKNISLLNAFKAANNVLLGAVKGISDLITRPGLINVDFADVRTVMSEMGMAMMGTGSAVGEQRARQAAEAAIASPLLEDVNFSGARGILVNITAGLDMSIGEFEEVGDVVKEFISDDATVVVGTVIDPEMTDEMRVTVIVTGLGDNRQRQQQPQQPLRARLVETTRSDGSLDYQQLERPAVIRKQAQTSTTTTATKQGNNGSESIPDVDYLDIPAFLRRQEEA